jgi:predicted TIM-barrel fold metal-dependent hydrolase
VPVYLHLIAPTPAMLAEDYVGNYPILTTQLLSTQGWGWHELTGLHFLRLFASGFFDAFSTLKLILGHMGEMLPFQLARVIHIAEPYWVPRKRDLQTVWNKNVWVTTSGFFTLPPLQCLLGTKDVGKVIYSVDWPYANNTDGMKFLELIRDSGLVTEEEWEGIAWRNAAQLLKLNVTF